MWHARDFSLEKERRKKKTHTHTHSLRALRALRALHVLRALCATPKMEWLGIEKWPTPFFGCSLLWTLRGVVSLCLAWFMVFNWTQDFETSYAAPNIQSLNSNSRVEQEDNNLISPYIDGLVCMPRHLGTPKVCAVVASKWKSMCFVLLDPSGIIATESFDFKAWEGSPLFHRPIGFNTKMVLLGLDDFGPSQCEQLPTFDAGRLGQLSGQHGRATPTRFCLEPTCRAFACRERFRPQQPVFRSCWHCFTIWGWVKPVIPYNWGGWTFVNPSHLDVKTRGMGFWPKLTWCYSV